MKAQGTTEELGFWKMFVHTPQFQSWLAPGATPELDPLIAKWIQDEGDVDVLDVGSGVVSILNGLVKPERLTACDLLAEEYAEFFDYAKHGLDHPLAIAAEDLDFDREFGIVHMRNALDHCQNPQLAYENLRRAVRPGGLLIVACFENEGSHLNGLGMHQWDITVDEDKLLLTPRGGDTPFVLDPRDGSRMTATYVSLRRLENGRNWVTWVGRKDK